MIQIALILVLGIIIAAIAYTLLSGSKQKRKEIVVPLQDLSKIWVVSNQRTGEWVDKEAGEEKIEEVGNKEIGNNEIGNNELSEEKNDGMREEKRDSGLGLENHEDETEETEPKLYKNVVPPLDKSREYNPVKPDVKPEVKPDEPAIDTTFYEECIKPYADILKTKNLDTVVKELLTILNKYKNTSSIVQKPYDEEAGDLHIILDAIKGINIRDHTYSVTRILIDFTKNTYISYEEIIPVAIIAGLAHDIGKIKELTGKEESHSVLSIEILTGIVNKVIESVSEDKPKDKHEDKPEARHEDKPEARPEDKHKDRQPDKTVIELAAQAIKNHHVQTADQLTTLLKKADQTARGYELMLRAKDMKVMSFSTWFNAEKYINSYIAPEINSTQGNACQAFSFSGIVYVRTEYLHEAAYRMCANLKIIDTVLLYESERQNVIRKIVTALSDAGYIHDMLQSPRISMKFELVQKMGGPKKNILTLTPLKGDSFDLQNLEQKKTDFLLYIEDVKRIER